MKAFIPVGSARMAAAALAVLAVCASCSRGVSRQQYVESWIIASLRAFEKDTPVKSELVGMYASFGLDEEAWKRAEELWFGEDSQGEINEGMLALLRARGNIGRSAYVLLRSTAYVRSRALGSAFGDEIGLLGRKRGFARKSWEAAERIWVGDRDTDEEILSRISRFEAAMEVVPFDTYLSICSMADRKTRLEGAGPDDARKLAFMEMGIAPADFEAVDGIWANHELVEAEILRRSGG